MAGEGTIGREMAASYTVEITGIERTKREMAALDSAIASLRKTQYSPVTSVTVASSLGTKDLFVTKIDALEGRVQGSVQKSMASAMALGRRVQTAALRAAVTETGASGASHVGGRNGPGRDDSGAMIAQIGTNVETMKTPSTTRITGWHGWGTEARGGKSPKNTYQEKGTRGRRGRRGVPAANSLGQSIPTVRNYIQTNLGKLR